MEDAKKSSHSFLHLLCKSSLFLIFLVAIPLFPSQAPSFVNQTILTRFWELVHLLFIGVAVSYGLFCRRNADMDLEVETQRSNFDDENSQSTFVSRIFHVSSFFENGYENASGSGEKSCYQSWNSEYYKDESLHSVDNGDRAINEESKARSLDPENGFEICSENDEKNVVQAWNSQYFQGESVVVVSELNCGLDECGKIAQGNDGVSLGLPIRSLKSVIRNVNSPPFSNGSESESESGSSLEGSYSSRSLARSIKERNFGDMGPVNLEEKFNENAAFPSPAPGRSMSGRIKMEERVGSFTTGPSHFRPLSADETQFEALKSQSFRSTTSLSSPASAVLSSPTSSQASAMSSSPTRLSPSHSVSSELPNSEAEDLGEKKSSSRASYPPASRSPSVRMNGDAPLNAFHLRRYSSGSLFQKDVKRNLKDELKDLREKRREDMMGSKRREQNPLHSDKRAEALAKASSRGKSVRTIRGSRYAKEEATRTGESKIDTNGDVGKSGDKAKVVDIMPRDEMKTGGLDHNLSKGTGKKVLDTQLQMPEPTFGKYQKREKEEYKENVAVETEEDSDSGADNHPISSNVDAVTDVVSESGYETNEVDRKAGEFIAKFREQIRLQKVASMERSNGTRFASNYFR